MYSDKYFLVPTSVNETQRPVDNILSNLDGEMMRILNDRNIPADVKWAQYNQILQRHNYMRKDRDKPIEIPFYEKTKKTIDTEQIFSTIPKTRIPLAKSLLDFIQKQPNIEVAENGEVVIDGDRIRNSNITDIMHDLTRDRKNAAPVGTDHLIQTLKEANIPLEYIGNKNRLDLFHATPSTPYYSSSSSSSAASTPKKTTPLRQLLGWEEA